MFAQEIEEEKEDSSDFDLSFREKAREVFHDVELAWSSFIQNHSFDPSHEEKITDITFNETGKFFSISSFDKVSVWSWAKYTATKLHETSMHKSQMSNNVVSAIDSDGKLLAVYQWFSKKILMFQIEESGLVPTEPFEIVESDRGREVLSSLTSDVPDVSVIGSLYFYKEENQKFLRAVK